MYKVIYINTDGAETEIPFDNIEQTQRFVGALWMAGIKFTVTGPGFSATLYPLK